MFGTSLFVTEALSSAYVLACPGGHTICQGEPQQVHGDGPGCLLQ